MERATIAIRRLLQREFPDVSLQQMNIMILAKMKQIEEEIRQSNNQVINRLLLGVFI